MTNSDNSSEAIWHACQEFIPNEDRVLFNPDISFCLQERDLRDRLIGAKRWHVWEDWKKQARPLIYSAKASKYSSAEYQTQKFTEYSRRADNWSGFLEGLLFKENILPGSSVLDVGSNDGEEVRGINFKVTCLEPSSKLCDFGRRNFREIKFVSGTADSLPFKECEFDVYLSLRTWCIAGVLADEALSEAVRVLRPNGLIIISFPLRFETKERELTYAVNDKVKPVAEWSYSLFSKNIGTAKTLFSPEDFIIYGRVYKDKSH